MNKRSIDYLLAGLRQVHGWLNPTTAYILMTLAERQTIDGITGDLAEIGVHHGKSLLALANSAGPGEKIFAIDVFEDQEKNLDASGKGSRSIFLQNIAAFAPESSIEIIQESSLDLPALGWPQKHAGSIRFFSIDGSHTREATLNDLRIAEMTTKPGAIVALDDFLNAHWLGVISGLVDYLSLGGKLVPFALVPNKLLLASDRQCAQRWREFIRSQFGRAISKQDVELLGHVVDVVEEDAEPSLQMDAELRRVTFDHSNEFTIDFALGGNSAIFTDEHWDGPEPWGRWTNATQAALLFSIGGPRDLFVTLFVSGLLSATAPKQLVWIEANRRPVTRFEFDSERGSGPQAISGAIPASSIDAGGEIVLNINTDRARSPKELGLGADARRLGLGVERVVIRASDRVDH